MSDLKDKGKIEDCPSWLRIGDQKTSPAISKSLAESRREKTIIPWTPRLVAEVKSRRDSGYTMRQVVEFLAQETGIRMTEGGLRDLMQRSGWWDVEG